jgi:uncharacterized protein
MAKSKKRGGEKAHRKRVQKRNQSIKAVASAYQKLFDETMRKQLEELQKKYAAESGDTQSDVTTDSASDDQVKISV